MRIFSLSSGSKGNSYCVETDGKILLIDLGISYKQATARLGSVGLSIDDVIAVVFTHNHSDHVSGLKTFHKKHPKAELYSNLMTAEAIATMLKMNEQDFIWFENGQSFEVGPFKVEPFSIPHDVPDPVGYLIGADGQTYFHATDVGTPLNSIGIHLALADVAVLESNHDPVLLAQSARAESLKQRIRGPRGHMSNDDCAGLVGKFAGKNLKRLALAHLSSECNSPHLAEKAMRETLAKIKREDVLLTILSQDCVAEI